VPWLLSVLFIMAQSYQVKVKSKDQNAVSLQMVDHQQLRPHLSSGFLLDLREALGLFELDLIPELAI